MSVDALLEALDGRFDRWWWSPGLTPSTVAAALEVELIPRRVRVEVNGHTSQQAFIKIPSHQNPVHFRWDLTGELVLVALRGASAKPSWDAVSTALGRPDAIFEHEWGVLPGSEQECYFRRGLTMFGGGLGYQAVWLYSPMSDYFQLTEEYSVL